LVAAVAWPVSGVVGSLRPGGRRGIHPNPHKAREGKKKHRLILEPIRAAVVLLIFEDYCLRQLGMGAICDKLNRDLERYPPPARNPKDENGLPPTWSKSQIQGMLRNPKSTGYNVWNRHDKRKGRPLIRPREEWIWSPTPSHEAIVPKELFDMVTERAKRNEVRPRQRAPHAAPQRTEHRKGRLYPLRGRVRCGLCGRRMEGSHQKGNNWYRCRFVYNRGAIAADAAGHPRALGIKEETHPRRAAGLHGQAPLRPRPAALPTRRARQVRRQRLAGPRRGAGKARERARAASTPALGRRRGPRLRRICPRSARQQPKASAPRSARDDRGEPAEKPSQAHHLPEAVANLLLDHQEVEVTSVICVTASARSEHDDLRGSSRRLDQRTPGTLDRFRVGDSAHGVAPACGSRSDLPIGS
jgi:hypothetical protein